MESFLAFIAIAVQLVAANNWVMSFAKQFQELAKTDSRLRLVLVVLSLIGVLSASALTGNAVDLNSVTDLVVMVFEVAGLAIASHWSYKAIKEA